MYGGGSKETGLGFKGIGVRTDHLTHSIMLLCAPYSMHMRNHHGRGWRRSLLK